MHRDKLSQILRDFSHAYVKVFIIIRYVFASGCTSRKKNNKKFSFRSRVGLTAHLCYPHCELHIRGVYAQRWLINSFKTSQIEKEFDTAP